MHFTGHSFALKYHLVRPDEPTYPCRPTLTTAIHIHKELGRSRSSGPELVILLVIGQASNEDSGESAHERRLTRAFAVRIYKVLK